jgi:hypothetical protein
MNKSILLLAFLFFASCAKDSSSPTSFAPVTPGQTPVVSKVCQGMFQRAWLNSNRSLYNLYSNCTGTIPHCEAEFDYEVDGDSDHGIMKITLKKSVGGTNANCPAAPGYTECEYRIYPSGVNRGKMGLTCDGSTEIYTPMGNLE